MRFFFSILFFLSSIFVYAQEIDQLQSEIENSEREIERINNLLRSNREQQTKSSQRVVLLEKRLQIRQNLLKQTNIKISSLESGLKSCDSKVLLCESKIDSIKRVFSSLVLSLNLATYENDVLPPESINLSLCVNDFNSLISQLDSVILLTGITRKDITSQKKELESLQIKRNKEISSIISETESLASLKKELKIGESQMVSEIETHRLKINELQRQIEKLISAENSNILTIDSKLTEGFLSKKGSLPSPLAVKCQIIDYYGTHAHPTIKGVKVSNIGVNLSVPETSDVLCVYDGEVRGVYTIAGMANTVLVRHGKYITVYANLSSVEVSKGQKVTSRQTLGKVTASNSSDVFLHFELWRESTTLDPSLWIKF